MKKLLLVLCMITSIFSMTANATTETKDYNGYTADDLKSNSESLYTSLSGFSDDELTQYLESGDEITVQAVQSWSDIKNDLGEYVGIGEFNVEESDDAITTTLLVDFSETDMILTVVYDPNLTVTSIVAGKADASVNSITGWGIFLGVLVVVGGIFVFSNKKRSQDDNDEIRIEPVALVTPVAVAKTVREENLVDDLELVAVISAAIAASMNTSTDGFVVRSIKRRTKRIR